MKTNITTTIIDDDEVCTQSLCKSLSAYTEFIITGVAKDAISGKQLLLEQRPDLLFLDVELPDTSGIEMLRQLKEHIYWPMRVIFYTAYEKYLLEALRESAFDYLLKPYEENEFQKVITRYLATSNANPEFGRLLNSLSSLLPQNRTFLVATITGYQLFRIEQIGCFDYSKHQKQWNILSTNPTNPSLKRTTRATDILQYSNSFIQINQHQIINIEYLYAITDKTCRMLPPFDTLTDLHISRIFMKELQDSFNKI
nr:response regulator transcription factor [uncultured Macellibacteroides sp.]